MSSRRDALVAALAVMLAGVLTGCGSDEDDSPTAGSSAEEVKADDTALGPILVDQDGMTLYVFTKDSPAESVCTGECLRTWPPVSGDVEAGDGAQAHLLGSIERDDGTSQATYKDMPLYYYAQDDSAGDVNGQGVQGTWYVLAPDGSLVKKPAPPSGGGGGGYSKLY